MTISVSDFIAEAMFGIINSILLVPICISFATIIYRDPFFNPHLPMLIKLVMFSCFVHQSVFTMRSTLPFAVGQVQDAGLIFLSAIASTIVQRCKELGSSDQAIISTVLVTLSLCTGILGIALVGVGRLKLASLVQYLPMPVVGGYLAFIGFFCGQAGLALMAQVEVVGISDWPKLFATPKLVLLQVPGVVLALSLYSLVRRVKHMLTMPCFLVGTVSLFYLLLLLTGSTLQDARDFGWVSQRSVMGPCYQGWTYLDFRQVEWSVVPTIALSWAAMVFVVAFSSCLDVAAIEMEIKKPLEYNRELTTVGVSNVVSGFTGGYTGSYIFSQTIFNLRARVKTRVTGCVILTAEALVFLLPFSPMAYLPRSFFGCLLLLIAIDLCVEWLWLARAKMAAPEYAVNLFTFAACLYGGVEAGIVFGVGAAMAAFIVSYAQIPAFSATSLTRQSTVMRTFEERRELNRVSNQVLLLSVKGYIFFGSSVRILQDAKDALSAASSFSPPPCMAPPPSAATPTPAAAAGAPLAAAAAAAGGLPRLPTFSTPPSSSAVPILTKNKKKKEGSSPSLSASPSSASPSSASPSSRHHKKLGGGLLVGMTSSPVSYSPIFNRAASLPPRDEDALEREQVQEEDDEEKEEEEEEEEEAGGGAVGGGGGGGGIGGVVGGVGGGNGSSGCGGLKSWLNQSADSNERSSLTKELGPSTRLPSYQALPSQEISQQRQQQQQQQQHQHQRQEPWQPLTDVEEAAAKDVTGEETAHRHSARSITVKPPSTPVRYAILDFSGATGLDASAARSCFLMLKQVLKANGITCVFVVSSKPIRDLLVANGVMPPTAPTTTTATTTTTRPSEARGAGGGLGGTSGEEELDDEEDEEPWFESFDEGLEWCEEKLLASELATTAATSPVALSPPTSSSSPWPPTTTSSSPLRANANAGGAGALYSPIWSTQQRGQEQQWSLPADNSDGGSGGGSGGSGSGEAGEAAGGGAAPGITFGMSRHPSYYKRIQDKRLQNSSSPSSPGESQGGGGGGSVGVSRLATIGSESMDVEAEEAAAAAAATVTRTGPTTTPQALEQVGVDVSGDGGGLIQASSSSPSSLLNGAKQLPQQKKQLEALVSILEDYLELSPHDPANPLRSETALDALSRHFTRDEFVRGQIIWEAMESSQRLHFVERGTIDLVIPPPPTPQESAAPGAVPGAAPGAAASGGAQSLLLDASDSSPSGFYSQMAAASSRGANISGRSRRLQRISAGGTCGELGFFLGTPQMFRGVASSRHGCVAWTLDREQFLAMQVQHPDVCILVQTAVVKSLCLFDSQQITNAFSSLPL